MLQRKDNVTQNPLRHLGGGGVGVSVCDFLQKLGSKQDLYSYLVILMPADNMYAHKNLYNCFDISISLTQFSSNGSNGDKAWARRLCRRENGSEGMIEGPSDSFLQALSAAISCCFISRWVEVIRGNKRGLRLAGRSDGYRHFSNHAAHNLHIVCENNVSFCGNMTRGLTYHVPAGQSVRNNHPATPEGPKQLQN